MHFTTHLRSHSRPAAEIIILASASIGQKYSCWAKRNWFSSSEEFPTEKSNLQRRLEISDVSSPVDKKNLSMTIKYRSTRGKQNGLRFEEVILGGLATDRGLFVPESIPTFTIDEIEKVIERSMEMNHSRLPTNHSFRDFCYRCVE